MTSFSTTFARWTTLGLAGLAFAFATAPAEAQDGYRDRGDRYQRAQSDSSNRSRTRSADNTRAERPSRDFARQESRGSSAYERAAYRPQQSDYRPRQRTVYEDRNRNDFRRVEPVRNDFRYVRPRYEPRSHLSLNLHYSRPAYRYTRYEYIEPYRHTYTYRPYRHETYVYRPAYTYSHYDRYRPAYGSRYYHAPAPRVIYDYYPLGYDCAPLFGISYGVRYSSHRYPRYDYPRSGLSIGIRYDYRR